MEIKFYICKHCGNIITFIKDKGVKVSCCGEEMSELIPNHTDGAFEKHIPVIERNGNKVLVKVGSVIHPMIESHYIEWISLVTNKGVYTRKLTPNDEPKALFNISEDEEIITTYEYCNLHGLWEGKNN